MKLSIVVPFKGSIEGLQWFWQMNLDVIKHGCIDFIFILSNDDNDDGRRAYSFLKENRIKVVIQRGRGIYNAFNNGVSEVKDGYVMFCGVDDRLTIGLVNDDDLSDDIIFVPYRAVSKTIFPMLSIDKFQALASIKRKIGMPHSHQGMVYSVQYLKEHPFNENYVIAGDYSHLLGAAEDQNCRWGISDSFMVIIDVGSCGISVKNRRLNRSETWRAYRSKFGLVSLCLSVIDKRLAKVFMF